MWSLPGNVCIAEYVSVSELVSVAVSLSVFLPTVNLLPASFFVIREKKTSRKINTERQVPIFFVHVHIHMHLGGWLCVCVCV